MNIAEWKKSNQNYMYAGALADANPFGQLIFVDATNGNDGKPGNKPHWALATLARAVTVAEAGDTILAVGSFSEAVTVTQKGLSIIGVGTGYNSTVWTSDADTISLTISANNVLVRNIKFRPPAYTAGLPASIQLGNANYCRIQRCRFQGKTASWRAIYSPVCNSDNVEISDCEFQYMNTATYGAGILGVEAGGLSYSAWQILRNVFASCVTAIDINGRVCNVRDNIVNEYGITAAGAVGAVLAMGIDLSGTSSGGNAICGNQLGGTYDATLYVVGASGDQWAGNLNVITGGLTAANPA